MDPHPDTLAPTLEASDRLESWKEVASYLKRGVTTVQRWEREEGLPVHRHHHDALGSIYAFKSELDAWRAARAIPLGSDIADARLEIDDALASSEARKPGTTNRHPTRWLRFMVAIVGLLALVATGAVAWLVLRATPPRVIRLMITPSSAAAPSLSGLDRDLAISPDGTRLAYVGNGGTQLFLRPMDQLEATPIVSGAPRHPFFSVDGAWVGFFDGNAALKKVAIRGGPVVTICRVAGLMRGASWGPDETIIFAINGASGLWRVSADGGEPQPVRRPNMDRGERSYTWPEILPGGRVVLFSVVPGYRIAALDLKTGTQKIIATGGTAPRYVSSGHLMYTDPVGAVQVVAFDLARLEVLGSPVSVLPDVHVNRGPGPNAAFDVARDGTLVYVPANTQTPTSRTLVWVDHQGHEEPLRAPARAYRYPRLAPDGTRVALELNDREQDIWLWSFKGETLTRFTFDPAKDWYPVWTPDSRRLVFASSRDGGPNIFWQAADGTGAIERLTQSPNQQYPSAVSSDGTRVVFRETGLTADLMVLELGKQRRVYPLVQTTGFNERNADISPDGRWLAYQSDESDQDEIYVRPFPDVASGRWQISTDGGTRPLWARNGQDLYYVAPRGALMDVRIDHLATFVAGAPTKLFEGPYHYGDLGDAGRTYDVSPDGQRFLMIKSAEEQATRPTSVVVVLNWLEELKRLVPKH